MNDTRRNWITVTGEPAPYGGAQHQCQCQHCYCINAGMSTGRTVPHMRCCKCGDERAFSPTFSWG